MSNSIDREVEHRLHERGVRYTRARRAVVAALAAGDGPRSVAELHEGIGGSVPVSSLYRSLAVLEECGVVAPHHGIKGVTRFELAEWITGHHHHLLCVDCGAIDDVTVPTEVEREVRRIVADIGALASFTTTSHLLEIEGRCSRCR